jgi:hypothetical protein
MRYDILPWYRATSDGRISTTVSATRQSVCIVCLTNR